MYKPGICCGASSYGSETTLRDKVLDTLHREYREADLGNQPDPIDELIFISLARQTHHWNALRSWEAVQEAGGAVAVHSMSLKRLARILAPAGLSNQKARWIKECLRLIEERFGSLTLAEMATWGDDEVESFLTSLPGISIKSAKCIMLYSMDRKVLPVDTHVRRVSERLGLLQPGLSERKAHDELELVIPPKHRYSYHVNSIWHGRKVCRAPRPSCEACALAASCPSAAELSPKATSKDAT